MLHAARKLTFLSRKTQEDVVASDLTLFNTFVEVTYEPPVHHIQKQLHLPRFQCVFRRILLFGSWKCDDVCYNIKCDNIINVRKAAFVTLRCCTDMLVYKLFGSLLTVYGLHPFCVYVMVKPV